MIEILAVFLIVVLAAVVVGARMIRASQPPPRATCPTGATQRSQGCGAGCSCSCQGADADDPSPRGHPEA